jgi:hypothetical protein
LEQDAILRSRGVLVSPFEQRHERLVGNLECCIILECRKRGPVILEPRLRRRLDEHQFIRTAHVSILALV